jgi:hypothetical protein
VAAAIVAGIIQCSDIIPYAHHNTSLCSMPILNYIRCCNPDFNITYTITRDISTLSGSIIIDDMLPKTVHDPVCGLASIGSCQPLLYAENLEHLNISAGEMVFGITENGAVYYDNWTIVGICGLCALALAMLAYFSREVHKTCCQDACCQDTSTPHYSPIK